MEVIKIRFSTEPDSLETVVEKNLTDMFQAPNSLFRCSDCLWIPAMDMVETPDEIFINAEIAGVEKKDLAIEITQRAVKISGRRRPLAPPASVNYRLAEIHYGKFERVLYLPQTVDSESISASYSRGFLTIKLKKRAAETRYQVPISED